MDKPSNFKENLRWFLVILALMLGLISIVMTVLSKRLEEKPEASPTANAQFWVDKEEINVINVLSAGPVLPFGKDFDGSEILTDFEPVVRSCDMAALSVHGLVNTDVSPAFADRLYTTGFTMCGLAYPDVLAQGKEAVDLSNTYWNNSKMRISGTSLSTDAKNQLRFTEVNGISAVYLSFTDVLNDPLPENETYLVNVYDDEKTPLFVNKAAELADIVIVSITWNGESGALPNDRQKKIAEALAGAGASIIIGYAEDAVQPIAWIDDTLVFYSLGNLCSPKEETAERIGALGAVTVSKTVTGNQKRIELTNPKADLVITVQTKNGWKTKYLSSASEEEAENHKALYDGYIQTLLRMDDSIRIGGLG